MVVLIALGALTKSAQIPCYFWLPNAMAGRTPVSALLHSATMVKAGVYLVARLSPHLGGEPVWLWMLVPAGLLTMLVGALRALGQTDLKRILAFSTVSVLGMLIALFGAGTEKAVEAGIVLLVAHALFKAALFIAVGAVDVRYGTSDIRRVGGLPGAMPLTTATLVIAGASMAGVPPLLGFAAKEAAIEPMLGLDGAFGVTTA